MPKPIAFDLEIVRTISNGGAYSFERPWELGVAVAVTYDGTDFRDWFGGYQTPAWDSPDMIRLAHVLRDASEVITFNGIRFDYRVLDGYLDPRWHHARAGLDRNVPDEVCRTMFAGRSVDLLLDIQESLGRRVSLDACMKGTLGIEKSEDSARIPAMWRAGQRAEVIASCREHTKATWDIWAYGNKHGHVLASYGTVTNVPVKWRKR